MLTTFWYGSSFGGRPRPRFSPSAESLAAFFAMSVALNRAGLGASQIIEPDFLLVGLLHAAKTAINLTKHIRQPATGNTGNLPNARGRRKTKRHPAPL